MLNLLPKDCAKEVRSEYVNRFYIVLLIGLTIVDIFFLVALSPSYISVNMKRRLVEETSQSIKNSSIAKDRDVLMGDIKKLEERLNVVATLPGDRPSDLIDKALQLKKEGVLINGISYTKKEKNRKEVSLEGIALNRGSLIEFSRAVKASDWTSSSDIPLSNLASDKDIKFFVSLILNK